MDTIDTNPRATKALKTEKASNIHDASPSMCTLAHVETVMHRVLQFLPLADLDEFLSACGDTPDLEWTLQDAHLWAELLELQFGGRRRVVEELPPNRQHNDDDDDDDDDNSDADDNNSDDEDEDEDDSEQTTTDVVPVNATQENVDEAHSVDEASATTEATTAAEPANTSINLEQFTLPAWFDAKNACEEAREFVLSLVEWKQFNERVSVLRGDIGVIQQLNGRPIDAIAFAGNSMCTNAHNGSSGVVFRRAGAQLQEYSYANSVSLRPGQSRVTPGFNAGVRVIIHCHGPYIGYPNTFPVLAQTYTSALANAMGENVDCLAMTSISTGNHALPIPQATRTAIAAIQKFLRLHHAWQGHLGVVCYDGDVLAAFASERERVLSAFNVTE